ncbi:MAG: YggS family pyridoxal phosphate enzyme [Pirellulaceae bacterium]|nr:MAG: YggS family pyridoxal phosphate enzyme [Pirellulaceae bacterium]
MSSWRERITENLTRIHHRIQQAALSAGRDPSEVRLVVVTKYVTPDLARLLVELGQVDLGESRPQELWKKADCMRDLPVRWHLVGHLQRNKVRRTLPLCHLIHSVDTVRLLDELENEAQRLDLHPQVLLEVNVSGDPNKHGFAPHELPGVIDQASRWQRVHIAGLMTMAALGHVGQAAAADFARLRQLRDELKARVPVGHSLQELSMGMSGDFEEAIAEGATWIRIGSAIFDALCDPANQVNREA